MTIATYEGIVEKGKIRLKAGANLPENAKVYVIVTDITINVKMGKKRLFRYCRRVWFIPNKLTALN